MGLVLQSKAQVFRAKAVFVTEREEGAHSAKGWPPRGLGPPTLVTPAVGPGHRGWDPRARNRRQGHTGIFSGDSVPSRLRQDPLAAVSHLVIFLRISGGKGARMCLRPLVCQLSGAPLTCPS